MVRSMNAEPVFSGTIFSRVFITAWPISLPIHSVELPTGAGGNGLITVPSGAITSIGLKNPEFSGTSGITTENSVNTQDRVLPLTLLTNPLVWG